MAVTLSGILTEVREPHPTNAEFPMEETLLAIDAVVRAKCPKAYTPMWVTPSSMVQEVALRQGGVLKHCILK